MNYNTPPMSPISTSPVPTRPTTPELDWYPTNLPQSPIRRTYALNNLFETEKPCPSCPTKEIYQRVETMTNGMIDTRRHLINLIDQAKEMIQQRIHPLHTCLEFLDQLKIAAVQYATTFKTVSLYKYYMTQETQEFIEPLNESEPLVKLITELYSSQGLLDLISTNHTNEDSHDCGLCYGMSELFSQLPNEPEKYTTGIVPNWSKLTPI
jgi:hypothetical protein